MAEVVTISSKGQIVIPSEIRADMGIEKYDKFLIVHDKESILLKKIKEEELKRKMKTLLEKFADEFKRHKITKKDVRIALRRVRESNA